MERLLKIHSEDSMDSVEIFKRKSKRSARENYRILFHCDEDDTFMLEEDYRKYSPDSSPVVNGKVNIEIKVKGKMRLVKVTAVKIGSRVKDFEDLMNEEPVKSGEPIVRKREENSRVMQPLPNSSLNAVATAVQFSCQLDSPDEQENIPVINPAPSVSHSAEDMKSELERAFEEIRNAGKENVMANATYRLFLHLKPAGWDEQWVASPVADMYADAVLVGVLQAESLDASTVGNKFFQQPAKLDRMHFKECLIELLQDMFGEESVPKIFKGEKLYVTVDNKRADIDLHNLEVVCKEDETFQQIVRTAVTKLFQSLSPTPTEAME